MTTAPQSMHAILTMPPAGGEGYLKLTEGEGNAGNGGGFSEGIIAHGR